MRENIYIHWRSDAEDEDGDDEEDWVVRIEKEKIAFVFDLSD